MNKVDFIKKTLLETKEIFNEAKNISESGLAIEKKKTFKDLVTKYDQLIEEFITNKIIKQYPNENIIGEESYSKSGSNSLNWKTNDIDNCWLIDPIDGTTNFTHQFPYFCSTIAYAEKEKDQWVVKQAGTFDPNKNELFWAAKNQGAWLNNFKLKIKAPNQFSESLLCTGFAIDRHANKDKIEQAFNTFKNLTTITHGVRRSGAAALDIAYVASGRLNGFWEGGLSPWDIAAGSLLVTEAGGKIYSASKGQFNLFDGSIICGPSLVTNKLIELI